MKEKIKVIFPKGYFEDIRKNKKQRVYDCFTFYNKIDILKIRLEEMFDDIDYFIICEGTKTFAGNPKPLFFEDNQHHFKKWQKKIIHIVFNDYPKMNFLDHFLVYLEKNLPRKIQIILRKILINIGGMARYKIVESQKNSLIEGLKYAQDEDIIIGLDFDEIIRREKIKEMREILNSKGYEAVIFKHEIFFYFLNGKVTMIDFLPGAKACKLKILKKRLNSKLNYLRMIPYFRRKFFKIFPKLWRTYSIERGGWHFSNVGDVNEIINQFSNIEHPEMSKDFLKNKKVVKKMIKKGVLPYSKIEKVEYINIRKDFPKYIQENKDKLKKYIHDPKK